MGLWLYAFRARNTTCNPHCMFWQLKPVVNYKRPTIFRRPCDRWQPLLSYWCPCNHEAKGSMQGKKGIIGKGDWCRGSRWTFWCVCVWGGGGGGHVALNIMLWALEIFLQYVTSGDFVLSSCHYLIIISVISSMCISSLVVLKGWRRRRHGAF
jgi:hypothetical protein